MSFCSSINPRPDWFLSDLVLVTRLLQTHRGLGRPEAQMETVTFRKYWYFYNFMEKQKHGLWSSLLSNHSETGIGVVDDMQPLMMPAVGKGPCVWSLPFCSLSGGTWHVSCSALGQLSSGHLGCSRITKCSGLFVPDSNSLMSLGCCDSPWSTNCLSLPFSSSHPLPSPPFLSPSLVVLSFSPLPLFLIFHMMSLCLSLPVSLWLHLHQFVSPLWAPGRGLHNRDP